MRIVNVSQGPCSVQADPKKPAIMIMPRHNVPLNIKGIADCDDVLRMLRVGHFRKIETATKKHTQQKGGDK